MQMFFLVVNQHSFSQFIDTAEIMCRRPQDIQLTSTFLDISSLRQHNGGPPSKRPSSRSSSTSLSTQDSRRSSVSFGSIEVREFDRIVGDHPDVSNGPPLSIGWEFVQDEAVTVDEYEEAKPPKSNKREENFLVRTKFERICILHQDYGYSIQELRAAEKEAKRVHKQREYSKEKHGRTVEYLESAMYAIGHRLHRVLPHKREC
jgi:hypothetical protein